MENSSPFQLYEQNPTEGVMGTEIYLEDVKDPAPIFSTHEIEETTITDFVAKDGTPTDVSITSGTDIYNVHLQVLFHSAPSLFN